MNLKSNRDGQSLGTSMILCCIFHSNHNSFYMIALTLTKHYPFGEKNHLFLKTLINLTLRMVSCCYDAIQMIHLKQNGYCIQSLASHQKWQGDCQLASSFFMRIIHMVHVGVHGGMKSVFTLRNRKWQIIP